MPLFSTSAQGASNPYIQLLEKYPSGSAGGIAANNSWANRITNIIQTDDTGGVSIPIIGSFILPSGTYYINASANFFSCNETKMRLYNSTDSTVILYGSVSYGAAVTNVYVNNLVSGKFTIGSNKTLTLQYYCKNRLSSPFNLGTSVDDGSSEIWSVIDLWKLS